MGRIYAFFCRWGGERPRDDVFKGLADDMLCIYTVDLILRLAKFECMIGM